mgnify:CR=1 FL=1
MLININKDLYVIKENISDKEVYSTKIVDSLPDDFQDYNYKYINGNLVCAELIPVKSIEDYKKEKYCDLEKFTKDLQNIGVEYNGTWFKCDEEAQMNLLKTIALNSFPVIWYSRDGYNSFIVMNNQEEFDAFKNAIASKMKEIEYQYYQYKFAIDNASTQEELDAIVFGGDVSDEVE